MFRILIVTTDNEPGVLDRVASTFRRRGFNIHSLTVSPTMDPLVSRMTLVTDMNANSKRSAKAFLERLLNVHAVVDLTEVASLVRDVALLRVRATAENRPALFQLAQIFQAEVLDVSPDSLVMSVCASPERSRPCWNRCAPSACWSWAGPARWPCSALPRRPPCPQATAEAIEDAVSF